MIRLTRKGALRWRAGHPWIFRPDIVVPDPEPEFGAIVAVATPDGRKLGFACWSNTSLIAVRGLPLPYDLDPNNTEALDEAWLALVDASIARRSHRPPCTRLVNGDSDGLPGLIIDRYGDGISVQTLTQTADRLKDRLLDRIQDRLNPAVMVLRNDVKVRALEGLEIEKVLVMGQDPVVVADFGVGTAPPLKVAFDLMEGQKTGGFLDQQDNRFAAAQFLHGEVLDCFSYDGGFSLALAQAGRKVTAVDVSEPALARLRENAERNGLTVETACDNVFDLLRAAESDGRKFDGIVLDPPAFCPNRKAIEPGRRAYKEINLRAFKLLRPGGRLVTWTCSAHMQRADFEKVVAEAAADAGRFVRVIERRSASPDHPTLITVPETDYLKGLHLEVQ